MTNKEAQEILQEMQVWRRGLPPYDGIEPSTRKNMPYTPQQFGEAIDTAIQALIPSDELIERIIKLHTEYRYCTEFTTESEISFIKKHLL